MRQWKLAEEIYKQTAYEVILIIPRRWPGVINYEMPFHRKLKGVKIVSSPTLRYENWYLSPFMLLQVIKDKPDILYAQSEPWSLNTVYGLFLAKIIGIPFAFFTWENLVTQQTSRSQVLALLKELFWKMTIMRADLIIVGSEGAKILEIGKGASPCKIRVLPQTGVDTDRFRPRYSTLSDKFRSNGKKVLFAGRLVHEKGIHVLLEAWKELVSEKQNGSILIICGRGPLKNEIKKLIIRNNLESSIYLIDWLPYNDMHLLYNIVDIFVYPSIPTKQWTEQFGFSMIEAMACRVPVIASNVGAIPEVVENNVSGILVPPNDHKALQGALRILLEDDYLRSKFGKAAQERVKRDFSLEVIARKTTDVLSEVVLSKRSDINQI